MTGSQPDGLDAARTMFDAQIPNRANRGRLIRLLLSSIQHARVVAPNAWGISLFRNGFRLNVGRPEVMFMFDGTLHVNFAARSGKSPFRGASFFEAGYALDIEQCSFSGAVADYPYTNAVLAKAHAAFIQRAGTTKSGRPVAGSPHRKSHEPGLVEYVETFTTGLDTDMPESPEADAGAAAQSFSEGTPAERTSIAYERNPRARQACLKAHGHACVICGLDFGDRYGKSMRGFIHVHHLNPLHEAGRAHVVDPVADMRPVCPNCHAVIHSRRPNHTIDDVKRMLEKARPGAPKRR